MKINKNHFKKTLSWWLIVCENSFTLKLYFLKIILEKIFNKSIKLYFPLGYVWLEWKQGGWKIGWKIAFFTVWFREKTREMKNKEKNFLSGPTFFYPPNLRGKWGGKSAEWYTLYKYSHFIHLTYPSLYVTRV